MAEKQAADKDHELQLEKERVRALSDRLKDAQTVAAGLETMRSQNCEILAGLEDQKADTTNIGEEHDDLIRER